MIILAKKDYLSIDIGGTFTKYALIDHSGNLKVKSKFATPNSDVQEFLKAIYQVIDDNIDSIRGIAFSIPGRIDKDDQTIYFGGALPMLHGLSLGRIIQSKYNLPVSMENDGKCAALAELWLGNLQGVENGAALVLGTAVGGGIILKGKLWSGTHFQGGELSFMLTQVDNRSDAENNIMLNAGSAVKMVNTIGDKLELSDPTDGLRVFKAIENDDPIARPIFEEYCRRIAYIITNTQAVLDLTNYVIGGGISNESILVPEINHQIQIIRDENPLLRDTLQKPTVETAKFKNDANLFGALYSLLVDLDDTHSVSVEL
ncbi:ROK family protein [Pediococcus argentinicus]|uniref:Transcriptional regulator n=1 Tax=Pediococcus argentinicus TaxID=480391 RepID=A0A0R2NM83_9LACO|nr:transcriptional regulator [Pediococcus argentinicus]GEP19655.1 sugar kinase [Pediococcus argentinicus]